MATVSTKWIARNHWSRVEQVTHACLWLNRRAWFCLTGRKYDDVTTLVLGTHLKISHGIYHARRVFGNPTLINAKRIISTLAVQNNVQNSELFHPDVLFTYSLIRSIIPIETLIILYVRIEFCT